MRIELTPRIVAEQILAHLRQAGVTPQLSLIYLFLRSRNFIFGGSVMNSTIPAFFPAFFMDVVLIEHNDRLTR
jgi:hypothetical protein